MDMFYKATRIHLNPIHSLERDRKFATWNQKTHCAYSKATKRIHQIKIDETFSEEEIKILKGFVSE